MKSFRHKYYKKRINVYTHTDPVGPGKDIDLLCDIRVSCQNILTVCVLLGVTV